MGDDLAHALLCSGAHAEVGIEGAQGAVEGEDRAREDGERGRCAYAVAVEDADDLRDRRRVEAASLQRREHHSQVELQRRDVDALPRLPGNATHRSRQHRRVTQGEAKCHLLQALERDGIDPADRTKVDEPQRAGAVDHHIPRMRIRVVDAIGEDLREEGIHQVPGELGARHPAGIHRGLIGHRHTRHLVHDEHALRRHVGVDLREVHSLVGSPGATHGSVVGSLTREVELLRDAGHELAGQTEDAHPLRGGRSPLKTARTADEDAPVDGDALFHVRALHLDDDAAAIAEDSAVGDSDRGRSQGLLVEADEEGIERGAELLLDHGAHGPEGKARNGRAQLGELVGDDRGKEVVAGRGDLPELHEHAARLLEREPERARGLGREELGARGQAPTDEAVLARDAGNVREPSRDRDAGLDGPDGARESAVPATGAEHGVDDQAGHQGHDQGVAEPGDDQEEGGVGIVLEVDLDIALDLQRQQRQATEEADDTGCQRAQATPANVEDPG